MRPELIYAEKITKSFFYQVEFHFNIIAHTNCASCSRVSYTPECRPATVFNNYLLIAPLMMAIIRRNMSRGLY
jgi:hypothetical protein